MLFDTQKFGQKILEYRKARSLTQEALGQQVGVTSQAVSRWENGDSTPDIATLPLVSKALGVSLDLLLDVGYVDDLERFRTQVESTYRSLRDDSPKESEVTWQMFRLVFQECVRGLCEGKRLDTGEAYCVNDHFWEKYTARWDEDGMLFLLEQAFYNQFGEINEEDVAALLGRMTARNIRVLKHITLEPQGLPQLHGATGLDEEELKSILLQLMEEGLIEVYDGGYCFGMEQMHAVLLLASFVCMQRGSNHRQSYREMI